MNVILEAKEHAVFTRDGDHLFMKKPITLLEALTGFKVRGCANVCVRFAFVLVRPAVGLCCCAVANTLPVLRMMREFSHELLAQIASGSA